MTPKGSADTMREAVIAGVGMTRFGKLIDRGYKALVAEVTSAALDDAGCPPDEIELAYYSNSGAGIVQGQESTRGQHAVRGSSLEGVPLVNVENACASGSTALHQAWLAVASGHVDVALAVGAEKLNHPDKKRGQDVLTAALDQDRLADLRDDLGAGGTGSVFMDVYARFASWYMERSGATAEDFALVAVKNHANGAANPKAHYGGHMTTDDVLNARRISGPLTLPMCAPLTDGAAAVVVTSPEVAARWGAESVRLLATVVNSGRAGRYGELVPDTARRAFAVADVSPDQIDVVECHDAAAPAELIVMEELGLCEPGDAPALLREGGTRIGGSLPVNPSGGLTSRGHPIGATGLAQIVELADQLRYRCGPRQVEGARRALAENAGGYLGPDAAVAAVTILEAA